MIWNPPHMSCFQQIELFRELVKQYVSLYYDKKRTNSPANVPKIGSFRFSFKNLYSEFC